MTSEIQAIPKRVSSHVEKIYFKKSDTIKTMSTALAQAMAAAHKLIKSMQPSNPRCSNLCLLTSFAILAAISCVHPHALNITGKWQEVGKTATFEFWDNQSFRTVDNMGLQVQGKYDLYDHGRIRFEIKHEDSNTESIEAEVMVAGDELIFKFGDTGEIEKYMRVTP